MTIKHKYFTHPEDFYQTSIRCINFSNFNLTIEEIQDLDQCIDFQCHYLESDPLPLPYKGIMEDLCPYFAKVWDCSLNLGHWIIQNQHIFKNKKIIEIGAGLAIPSMVLAKLGHDVTASDYHPHTQYFAQKNKTHNQLDFPFHQLAWTTLSQSLQNFDVIIASDILYEGKYISDLVQLCLKCLSTSGVFILCDPLRGYLQKFITEVDKFFLVDLKTISLDEKDHFLVILNRPSRI